MPDNVKDNPVEKREALLADRLRLHRGYRQRFVKERNGWTRTLSMPSATVSHRVTAWSLRGVAMQPKDTEERRRAIDRVNRAYADEDYDRYERLIERYCHRFGFDGDYGLFEDACTDARLFGHGIG